MGLREENHDTTTPGVRPITTAGEAGTLLVTLLLMLVALGAMVLSHLTGLVAEQRAIEIRHHARRARAAAGAELELARNLVNTAAYRGGKNTVLAGALQGRPALIAGTQVEVERISEASEWLRLRATAAVHGVVATAEAFVRPTAPVSGYRLLVERHPVALWGAPSGDLHTNATLRFLFPGGVYGGAVTAAGGFEFAAGATRDNTTLAGPHCAASPERRLLDGQDIGQLAERAALRVDDDLVAEIDLCGSVTRVRLYRPAFDYVVPRTRTRRVFSHFDDVEVRTAMPRYRRRLQDVERPVYETEVRHTDERRDVFRDVQVTATRVEPVHETRTVTLVERLPVYGTRRVERTHRERVWVPRSPPPVSSLAGRMAAAVDEALDLGRHLWRTMCHPVDVPRITGYRTAVRTRTERVVTGERRVQRTERKRIFSHHETHRVAHTRQVLAGTRRVRQEVQVMEPGATRIVRHRQPGFRTETYEVLETHRMPERLIRTEEVATAGVLYFAGPVRSVSGRVNGRVTIASARTITITGSIVYVDDAGNPRMLHGTDPSRTYAANPAYRGSAALGLIARGDIVLSRLGPERIEVNACAVSLRGKVAFDGLDVSPDGHRVAHVADPAAAAKSYRKDSLRRLGGVICRNRPVMTLLDDDLRLIAGYARGVAVMDPAMLRETGAMAPPGMPEEPRPVWMLPGDTGGPLTFTAGELAP